MLGNFVTFANSDSFILIIQFSYLLKSVFLLSTNIGHLNLFKRIKDNFGKLIVGVHSDEQVVTYKNKPIIPYKDRFEIVKSCKYVDDVYENADLVVTDNLLNKLRN